MNHHVRFIAKDLHRTDFISSERRPDNYNYGSLARLLLTFACYNPTIGYSQVKIFWNSKRRFDGHMI
jgi:Rab-GTPase-TBC domain-containing protein